MSGFFERLQDELVTAAERRAQRRRLPRIHWTRRTALVLVPLAAILIGVPAFAAVTGAIHVGGSSHIVNLNPKPCVSLSPLRARTTTTPPPADLVSQLGVLRRPKDRGDTTENSLAMLPFASGINLNYVRVRHQGPVKLTVFTAQDIHALPEVPKGCAKPPALRKRPAEPGVCLVYRYSFGATGQCHTAAELRRGNQPNALTSGRRHPAVVADVVPDGVNEVVLRFREHDHARTVRIPVVENTYVALVRGVRFARRPEVTWVGPTGARVVDTGGSRRTPRQTRLIIRSRARDRAAGPRPTVFPTAGGARRLFTLRFRPRRPTRLTVYTVRLVGQSTRDCRQRGRRDVGVFIPGRHGAGKGLVEALLDPPLMGGGSDWCAGTYHGTISVWPHGLRQDRTHHLYGRFSFRVR
ncbi:MAG TPA: hypothetical protein VJU60_05715 [Thermoleophilaceae bacterium]|nr:hypothetical protein [Thermoleophilaceae bacterium]